MNITAQPLLDRRRALELRAWLALTEAALLHGGPAPAALLKDMYETGVAHTQTNGNRLRIRIAGVSAVAARVGVVDADEILAAWRAGALDRLAGGVG